MIRTAIFYIWGILLFSCVVAAESATQIVIINPGGAGSTSAAKEAMAEFATSLQELAKTEVKSVYFPEEKSGIEYIEKNSPQLGIVSVAFYLAHSKKYNLQLQLQVKQQNSQDRHYLVVVPEKSPVKTLRDLQGRVIASNHLYEPEFLSLVFFGDKTTWNKNYKAKKTDRPYTAVRRMFRGRIDAVIVDSFQWSSLASLFGKKGQKMRIVAKSRAVPTIPVVSFGPSSTPVLQALTKLRKTERGQKILNLFGMDSFAPVNQQKFQELKKLWEQK